MKRRITITELCVAAAGVALLFGAWRLDRDWFDVHLTVAYCAREPEEIDRWGQLRMVTGVAGALLLLVARPVVGGWAVRRPAGQAAAAVGRIAVALVLALLASDLILRRGRPAPAPPHPPSFFPPIHLDARLGWAQNTKTTTTVMTDGREITYAINAGGFRARTEEEVPDPSKPTVLFAGESVAEGMGVLWDEAYPAIVGARLNVQIVVSAVWGYAHDQAYWTMQDELGNLTHPLAVVTLVMPEQLERAERGSGTPLAYDRSRLVLDRGSLVVLPAPDPRPAWWLDSPVRKLAGTLLPYHDASTIDVARAVFVATAREVRARGAYPLFVLTNWGQPCQPGAERSMEQRFFDGLEIPWVRVDLDPFSVEMTTHHPNAASHRRLADAIERALVDGHAVP